MKKIIAMVTAVVVIACVGCSKKSDQPPPRTDAADKVFLNGVVYTANPNRDVVTAIAIRDDRIIFAGEDAGARALVGNATLVEDLHGHMILPGLHDMHIHLMGIVPAYACDLDSRPFNLVRLAAFVADCLQQQDLAKGEWLSVDQWRFSEGNSASGGYTTLRQALDAASPDNPVVLWGDDGHHAAFNSAALARAVNGQGEAVGLSRATLASDFADYRDYVGVDARGEPTGAVNEAARALMQPPPWRAVTGLPPERMPMVSRALAAAGITSVLDGATPVSALPLYQGLAEAGQLTFNLDAALWQENPGGYLDENGDIDIPAMVAELKAVREAYQDVPGIETKSVKIFVDGVLEGSPLNDPPSLPNAAVLSPYQQPIFKPGKGAELPTLVGYVDTGSDLCRGVRENQGVYDNSGAVASFRKEHGFHPAQCRISRGVLEHPREFILDYMAAVDAAGFKIHAHVIGDRAVRTALDGLEALRNATGSSLRHSLVHVQLVAPEDYQRIGDLGLYLAFSFGWAAPSLAYDLSVNPFIDELAGNDDLYRDDSYYMRNAYPVGQLQALGGIPVSGSDAPVDTRDPRPFFNIQQAVTRAGEGQVMNPEARISVGEALDAYTINSARLFGHESETGSLEVGKYADLVVIDRDLLALEAEGHADEIAEARVLVTVFRGREIHRAQ